MHTKLNCAHRELFHRYVKLLGMSDRQSDLIANILHFRLDIIYGTNTLVSTVYGRPALLRLDWSNSNLHDPQQLAQTALSAGWEEGNRLASASFSSQSAPHRAQYADDQIAAMG